MTVMKAIAAALLLAAGVASVAAAQTATNSLLINPAIGQKLPYDTAKDFAPVSMVATQPVALVANKSFPANTIPELVAVARKSAQPLNFTSPGPRGVGHLAGEMLKQRAGIDRLDRRAGAADVRHLALGQALRRFRRAQTDSGRRQQASRRRATSRDHRRDLSGLRRHCFQCPSCAYWRTRSGARQIVRRYSLGSEFDGVCGQGAPSRYLSRRQYAEGTRGLDAQGNAPLGGDRHGGEHQGR